VLRASVAIVLTLAWGSSVQASPVGQWVWSPRDAQVLEHARAARPDLTAAVHIAELRYDAGKVSVQLRLSPTSAFAIRFHNSFHAALHQDTAALAEATGQALTRVLEAAQHAAPGVGVLQLDYDCPVQALPAWAALLTALQARGTLQGYAVWLTSLIAHVREPGYGALFQGLAAGHIVQVFDTGERWSAGAEASLLRALERAGLPFCVGVGGFERGREQRRYTEHGTWWESLRRLSATALYQGTWVFPAGFDWRGRLGLVP
jgi:hypothetical protein